MTAEPVMGRMRDGYAGAVIELAQADPRVLFVSADCGAKERAWFAAEGAGRLVETGIAEANSIVVAAGLAAEGFQPHVLNFAYLLARMYNQIGQSVCEDAYNVKIGGYYAGVWGSGGRSHNCITDLAMMRALPNMTIYAPADAWAAAAAVRRAAVTPGPVYIRLAGVATPNVYDAEPEFAPVRVLTGGSGPTIFAHGTMVHEALTANAEGALDATVVDVTQIKPLPAAEIVALAGGSGVLVVEEHSHIGGLGEAVAALLAQERPVPLRIVAAPDMFPWSVLMETPDVYGKYGISSRQIVAAARALPVAAALPARG